MSRVATTDLFDLIKSLTKAEKRLFKLFAARHAIGGKNKYVRLFDAIEKQEVYDERALVDGRTPLGAVDLRSMKSYLYDLVLRSLRDGMKEKSGVAKVQYQIDKAELLIMKGLYLQAGRMLARAKEAAYAGGYWLKLIAILQHESALKVRSEETNTLERHEELYSQHVEALDNVRENFEYYCLFMRIYYLQLETYDSRSGEERSRLDAIMCSPQLRDIAAAPTLYSKMTFYEIHCRACHLTCDWAGLLSCARAKKALFDEHPAFRELHWYEYVYTCGTVLSYTSYFGMYDVFDACMAELTAVRQSEIECRVDLELVISYSELTGLLRRCRFDEAQRRVPAMLAFLEEHEAVIEISTILDFHIGFLILAIKAGDAGGARHWLGKLLNDQRLYRFNRFVEFAKLLSLVVHYDLEDEEGLESAIRSYYRMMKRKDKLHAFDTTLVLFLRKLPRFSDRLELRRALVELQAVLADLDATADGRSRLMQFEFATWLQSKINGGSFAELLRRKEEDDRGRRAAIRSEQRIAAFPAAGNIPGVVSSPEPIASPAGMQEAEYHE